MATLRDASKTEEIELNKVWGGICGQMSVGNLTQTLLTSSSYVIYNIVERQIPHRRRWLHIVRAF